MNPIELSNSSISEELFSATTFQNLYQNMSDAVAICDYATGEIKDCNNATLSLLNYSKEEILHLKYFDILPQYSSLFPNINVHTFVQREHVAKVMNDEEISIVGELITKDKKSVFAEFHIIPIQEKKGYAFIVLKNITEQVKNERKLISSEKRYKTIFNNACEAIVFFDLNTNKCIECNDVVIEMFGVPNKATFLNTPTGIFYCKENKELNPLSLKGFYGKIIREAKTNGSSCIVYQSRKLNGESFIAEITSVIKDDHEKYPRLISFIKDITQEYYAQKERDQLFSELSQMMDAMPLWFLYKDLENNIIKCNHLVREVYDDGTGIVEGRNLADLLPKEDAERYYQEDLEIAKNRQPKMNIIRPFMGNNGKKEWLKVNKIPFLDLDGNPKGIMIYSVNISDIVKTREEVKKKNIELKKYIESNSQLENFDAIASHDLQAPLRTIHSYTQLLQRSLKDKATEDQKDFMHFITNATANMRHLIRDLRSFSKVDSTQLNLRTINVGEMLQEVLRELQSTIDHQKAVIKVTDNMPIIDGDRIKLRQLFQNLITNALKYVDKDVVPNILISFENQKDFWCFKVKDNGIGIASEYQEKIFQLFQRLHNKDEYVGTGIGLSLCKKVVDQHLGEIGVESQEGKGSTFYYTIHKEVAAKLAEFNE